MSTWQIGESGTEVAVNDELEGEVSFTVTNGGTEQDRSMLIITALDGAAEAWFEVKDPQRAVPPGQSATYLCKVTIPKGTAPATYAMQAVAYSADRDPGETSATSKRVTIVVPEVKAEDRGTPWWYIAIPAVVLLLVIAAVLYFFVFKDDGGPNNTEAPTIEGTPEVLQNLTATPGEWSEEEGLTVTFQWERCDGDGEACEDIASATLPVYPVGADDLGQRLRVSVTASDGDASATATSEPTAPVTETVEEPGPVPNVVTLTRSAATALLRNANFVPVRLTAGDPVDNCNPVVESQAPEAGTILEAGAQVSISTRPVSPAVFCPPNVVVAAEDAFLSAEVIEFAMEGAELVATQTDPGS